MNAPVTKKDVLDTLARLRGYRSLLALMTPFNEPLQGDLPEDIDLRLVLALSPEESHEGGVWRAHRTGAACLRAVAREGQRFDMVFVDGYHSHEAAIEDLSLALDLTAPGGVVVAHDSFPHDPHLARPALRAATTADEMHQVFVEMPMWCGDGAYALLAYLRASRPDLRVSVVDTDFGVGIIEKGGDLGSTYLPEEILETLSDYDLVAADPVCLLGLVSPQDWLDREIARARTGAPGVGGSAR